MGCLKIMFPLLSAALAASACFADEDHPDLWFCGRSLANNSASLNEPGRVITSDGIITNWQDGAILHICGKSTGYFPEAVVNAVTNEFPARGVEVVDNSYLSFLQDTFAYKLCYCSGGRWLQGTGKLTLGAGGFEDTGWDTYSVEVSGGICLGESQTWNLASGSVTIQSPCVLSANGDIVWTVTSATAKTLSIASASDLSNVDIILKDSVRLSLSSDTAALNARSLTVQKTVSGYPEIHLDSLTAPCLDGRIARRIILDGDMEFRQLNGVALDLDNLIVTNGSVTIGTGVAYSIKDGKDQPLTVEEGASVRLATLPTNGTFKISGAGTLTTTSIQMKSLKFENFTGTLVLTAGNLSYLQLPEGCEPSGYEISGSVELALPATDDWPAGMTVTQSGQSRLYLPDGSSVDTSKILGTPNYSATARGIVEETGTVTVGAGETLFVAGDGFGAESSITLDGGTLHFLIDSSVAAPVSVTSESTIVVTNMHAAVLSGNASINAFLHIETASLNSSVSHYGSLIFTGGGSAKGNIRCSYGNMEFRGGVWSFEAGMFVEGDLQCRRVAFTDGVKATFAPGDDTEALRKGLLVGSAASYPITLEISGGAEVVLNMYRQLRIGDTSWRNVSSLVVDGATLKVLGCEGEFDIGGEDDAHLMNTTDDRCSRATIKVVNGGVIETDRVLSSPPITHQLDGDATVKEGLHLTLDGGTYRLGPEFGIRDNNPAQHPNQLFGGARGMNVSRYGTLTNTCEIEVTVGVSGATFDLSNTRPECTSFTNTVADLPVGGANTDYFPSGYFPCLGPRWIVNGPLNVKGNGNQELVINGLDPSVVTAIGADGAVVRIVGDTSASLQQVTLGAAGGGLTVETSEGAPKPVAIDTLSVAADGVGDLSGLVSATISSLVFAENSMFVLPETPLSLSGKVTLASAMRYFASARAGTGGPVVTATGGVEISDGEGVTWSRVIGSRRRKIVVSGNQILANPPGMVLTVK